MLGEGGISLKYIDTKKIAKSEGNGRAAILLPTIMDYFEDPEHQQAFEAWKKQRKTQEESAAD